MSSASWYSFAGPVQGGWGPMGAEDDERRRRRRDAYRDGGAPYSGGASGGGILPDASGRHPASGPYAHGEQGGQASYDAWGSSAPRQAAAVDMGQGAVQQQFQPVQAQAVQYIGGSGYMGADPEEKADEPVHQGPSSVGPVHAPRSIRQQQGLPDVQPASWTELDKSEALPSAAPAEVLREEATYRGGRQPHTFGPIRGGTGRRRAAPYSSSSKVSGLLGSSLQSWYPDDPGLHSTALTVAGSANRAQQHASNLGPGSALVQRAQPTHGAGERTQFRRPAGFGQQQRRSGPRFNVRGDKAGPGAQRGTGDFGPKKRGFKKQKWVSRAPTQGERQQFPPGVQKSQAHEYAKHREGTEFGERFKFPRGVQPSQGSEYANWRRRKGKGVRFQDKPDVKEIPKGKAARFTGGKIADVDPSEKQGYMQYGRMLGARDAVAKERRNTHRQISKLKRQNKEFVAALRKRGGEQLGAREKQLQDMTRQGGQLVQKMHGMQKEGELLQARVQAGGRQLSQRDATIRAKQQRIGQLLQEGRGIEAEHKARMQAGGRQLSQRDATIRGKQKRIEQLLQEGRSLEAQHKQVKTRMMSSDIDLMFAKEEYDDLKKEANRRIQSLEKKLNDGSADREAAQKEIDELAKQLAAASKKPEAKAPEQRQDLSELKKELAAMRAAIQAQPRGAPSGAGGAPPIVVQGGHGGGGASAGGSSSSGGAAAGGGPGGGRDMSRTVEALAKAVKGARKGDKPAKKAKAPGTKGITQARRSYTDKRKSKIAELRSLKGKRIREYNQRTKKMPKAERDKARREFKKKVEAQFKEAQQRFPTARGLKSVGAIRELIRKLDAFRAAK